jgi:N-acetylneuraminic acid mutarotase
MMKLVLTVFLSSIFLVVLAQPTANFWTKKNDFTGGKRERAVAFSIGAYGYLATGVDTAEIVKKDLWRYDAATDTWQQMADLPGNPRRDAVGFALGSKAYVGLGIDNDFSVLGNKLKDLWEYDPSNNSWTQKADYPGGAGNGVYFATAFAVDNKGYVCCGKVGPNSYISQLWEFKPSINQWTQRASFPGGVRYQLSSFSIGNYGYVGLGANQDVFKKDFWRYNPGSNTWNQIAELPGSARGNAVTFTIDDRGFVCMGTDGGLLDDLWEYNPNSNSWAIRAFYGGSERKNAVGFVVNGKAYVGTGKGYSGKKQGFEEYTPHNFASLDEQEVVQLDVYPNPATERIYCYSSSTAVKSYALFTLSGAKVYEVESTWSGKTQITVEGLEKGLYLVVAMNNQGEFISSHKVMIQ